MKNIKFLNNYDDILNLTAHTDLQVINRIKPASIPDSHFLVNSSVKLINLIKTKTPLIQKSNRFINNRGRKLKNHSFT